MNMDILPYHSITYYPIAGQTYLYRWLLLCEKYDTKKKETNREEI
jgi:hypothetical protein